MEIVVADLSGAVSVPAVGGEAFGGDYERCGFDDHQQGNRTSEIEGERKIMRRKREATVGAVASEAVRRDRSLNLEETLTEIRGRRKPKRILFFPGKGVIVENPGNGRAGPGGIRGEVVKWSSASRRRMRRFMIEHRPPIGWYCVGGSFTIPGPVLPKETCAGLWKDFSDRLQRAGVCMVWRV